jgi:hypothetical protein
MLFMGVKEGITELGRSASDIEKVKSGEEGMGQNE